MIWLHQNSAGDAYNLDEFEKLSGRFTVITSRIYHLPISNPDRFLVRGVIHFTHIIFCRCQEVASSDAQVTAVSDLDCSCQHSAVIESLSIWINYAVRMCKSKYLLSAAGVSLKVLVHQSGKTGYLQALPVLDLAPKRAKQRVSFSAHRKKGKVGTYPPARRLFESLNLGGRGAGFVFCFMKNCQRTVCIIRFSLYNGNQTSIMYQESDVNGFNFLVKGAGRYAIHCEMGPGQVKSNKAIWIRPQHFISLLSAHLYSHKQRIVNKINALQLFDFLISFLFLHYSFLLRTKNLSEDIQKSVFQHPPTILHSLSDILINKKPCFVKFTGNQGPTQISRSLTIVLLNIPSCVSIFFDNNRCLKFDHRSWMIAFACDGATTLGSSTGESSGYRHLIEYRQSGPLSDIGLTLSCIMGNLSLFLRLRYHTIRMVLPPQTRIIPPFRTIIQFLYRMRHISINSMTLKRFIPHLLYLPFLTHHSFLGKQNIFAFNFFLSGVFLIIFLFRSVKIIF